MTLFAQTPLLATLLRQPSGSTWQHGRIGNRARRLVQQFDNPLLPHTRSQRCLHKPAQGALIFNTSDATNSLPSCRIRGRDQQEIVSVHIYVDAPGFQAAPFAGIEGRSAADAGGKHLWRGQGDAAICVQSVEDMTSGQAQNGGLGFTLHLEA